MIRLVINADDLGLHPKIDEGILKAHRDGVLTSATVLVTGPHAKQAVSMAKAQGLAMGLHLCLSTGLRPAAPAHKIPSLLENGVFRKNWAQVAWSALKGQLKLSEVALEWDAQLSRARELGFSPDHLDSHQHLHLLPGIREVVCTLSKKEKLPLRWPREWLAREAFVHPGPWLKSALLSALGSLPMKQPWRKLPARGIYDSGTLHTERLLSLIEALPKGNHELVTHPGEEPTHVPEDAGWRYGWKQELEALTHPEVKARIRARGITLCSYSELFAVE